MTKSVGSSQQPNFQKEWRFSHKDECRLAVISARLMRFSDALTFSLNLIKLGTKHIKVLSATRKVKGKEPMDPMEFKSQPVRELAWLARFFMEHGHTDLANQLCEDVKGLSHKAQETSDGSGTKAESELEGDKPVKT
jgi:hypothetical protein